MSSITKINITNFKSMADLNMPLGPVTLLFGPNGSGKSNFLDAIWFFHDCIVHGVSVASRERNHGIGMLWDGANDDANVEVLLTTESLTYEIKIGVSQGLKAPILSELLTDLSSNQKLISRNLSPDVANLFVSSWGKETSFILRELDKLSLGTYLDLNPLDKKSIDLDQLLRNVQLYHSRTLHLSRVKKNGSAMDFRTRLSEHGGNLWSVLRNLHDRHSIDNRYDTIISYMKEAFPSFNQLVLEQTGPSLVYANFYEKDHRRAIPASGISDGHVQLLFLLTALFSDGPEQSSLVMFDEPEISLHPWAIAVFAKAVQHARSEYNRQVIIATHSPVLMSQFETEQVFSTEVVDGRTRVTPISSIPGIEELLEQYSVGSLYMAQAVGAQTHETPLQ